MDDSESFPPLGSDSTGFEAEVSSHGPDIPAPALDLLNLSS
ncbi:hypothetical protein ACWEZI_14060 [Staphylococcus shinii]|nr:hypothetical protein [Staphylococcus shinii]